MQPGNRLCSRPIIEAIDPEMVAVLRSKSGAERLQIASAMFASARRMLQSYFRSHHPDWDERQLQDAVARRLSHRSE